MSPDEIQPEEDMNYIVVCAANSRDSQNYNECCKERIKSGFF